MSVPSSFPKKRPVSLVFDWDNTLVDTWLTCYQALNQTLCSYGHAPHTPERFNTQPHRSLRESFPELFQEKAKEAEAFFYTLVHGNHLETLHPLPGAENLLQWATHQGIYLAVVSNKAGDLLRREVAHLGWGKYFQKVIGSYDTHADKPSPIPLLAALENSPSEPGHGVWFAGDSCVDIQCAQNAGCVPVAMGLHAAKAEDDVVWGRDCVQLHQLLSTLPIKLQAA